MKFFDFGFANVVPERKKEVNEFQGIIQLQSRRENTKIKLCLQLTFEFALSTVLWPKTANLS